MLEKLFSQSQYDKQLSEELITGFRNGFDIGYRGPVQRKDTSKNLPFHVGNLTELWNKVMKEVQAKRVAGPFEHLPCEYYVQSPLGLVPKSGNKMRLIFHLSYDFGEQHDKRSVNFHTPSELCTVKYNDIDHAMQNCLRLIQESSDEGEECIITFGKTDCSNAFRLAPVLVSQRYLLCMAAIHPITKRIYYFIDKCLPFGSSQSCAIFQKFSDALAFLARWRILKVKIVSNPALTNYLDDFLFMARRLVACNAMMEEFLTLCAQIACPISKDKTE